jgi:hypothetical protein
MFFKTLDTLRKKPAPVRRMIALSLSLGITTVIGSIWLVSYIQYVSDISKKTVTVATSTNPITEFGGKVSNSFSRFNNPSKIFKEDAESLRMINTASTSREELLQ